MAAPISADIAVCFEAMWNSVVDLRLLGITFSVWSTYTLRDHFRVAILVAHILAI